MYSYFNVIKDTRSSLLQESFIFFFVFYLRGTTNKDALFKNKQTHRTLSFLNSLFLLGRLELMGIIRYNTPSIWPSLPFTDRIVVCARQLGSLTTITSTLLIGPCLVLYQNLFQIIIIIYIYFFLIIEKVKRAYNIDYTVSNPVLAREEMIVYKGEKTISIYRENTVQGQNLADG